MTEHVPTRATNVGTSLKHVTLAVKYASDSWFPVSPDLVSQVRGNIVKGNYERECDALLADVEQDHALTTFLMKEFLPQLTAVVSCEASPLSTLREVGYQRLSESICRKGLSYSIHSLRTASREQVSRIAQSVIATGTTRILSEARCLPIDLGFSAAMMRQLGLSLIAWNYPHVYTRAISSLKPGDTVDERIGRVLGFTPATLALKLSAEWHLSPTVRFAMGDTTALRSLNTDVLKNYAINLSQICAVGEALARAHDPHHYPSAADDWELARQEITSALGSQGMHEIASWIMAHCDVYQSVVGTLFPNEGTSIFTAGPQPEPEAPSLYEACQSPLRDALDTLAAAIDDGAESKVSLQILLKKVVPAGGFARGCVYLVDPGTHTLTPRLPLGDSNIAKFKPIDYLSGTEGGSPILSAFHANTPIIERNVKVGEQATTIYSGSLGQSPRIGVIYLEASASLSAQIPPEILDIHFEAVKEAFEALLVR